MNCDKLYRLYETTLFMKKKIPYSHTGFVDSLKLQP